ncbi:MAG TPA: GNAT family N-acetyltransferase [Gaiellales bacterium]|nr:GNAT family N-acetyltransferase [Gaiellales bacterium]
MIRPAVEGDVPAIEALVREAYAMYVPRIGREPAPVAADHAGLVAAGRTSVVEADGEVAGVIVLIPGSDHLVVENVAVSPRMQGRGLGRELMAFAERRAAELGMAELRLYTNQLMTENLALYPALGYTETGRRVEDGFARIYFSKRI